MATIRVRALLWKPPSSPRAVHDGDTYWMLVDLKNNGFRDGATVCHVRLYGYSAREVGQPNEYGTKGKLIRVSGREARDIANEMLTIFHDQIEVELMGRDKYGRDVSKVYVSGDELGPILEDRKAVIAGAFKGLHGFYIEGP